MSDFRKLLLAEFARFQILPNAQLDALALHYELLVKWNRKLNLCRFADVQEAIRLHYCESLFLGHVLPAGALRIADVGSGAGFPGFPLAVLRPDCRVDLIESDQRKAAFLREVCDGAPNVCVIAERAEQRTGRYDWVVSRAVRGEEVRRLRLAPDIALLTTQPGELKIPWGERRFIQMFHVEL